MARPGAPSHGRPEMAAVVGDGDRAVDQRLQGDFGLGVGLGQRDLEARAAHLRLQLPRRSVGDRPTVVDHHDPVGQLVGLVEVLSREQERGAVGHQPADHLPHAGPAGRIKAGGRFVEKQNRRAGEDAGGQIEAPAHPARVGLHHPVAGVAQLELVEQLGGAGTGLTPAEAAQAADHDQVLAPGEQLVERRVLAGHADPALHLGRLAHDVEPGHVGGAAVRHGQRGQDPDRSRLAGAVRAEHAEDGSARSG